MKKATNKILSFLSAFAMVLGILVASFTSANAAEPNDTPARPVIEEPANPDENKPEKPTDDKDKQADDKDKFNDKKEFILDLGFDIDQIGESQIIIRSIPQIFDVPESDTFFY